MNQQKEINVATDTFQEKLDTDEFARTQNRQFQTHLYGAPLDALEAVARVHCDGHFTVLKFTTNWRVTLGTPNDEDQIRFAPGVGDTLEEAAMNAISHFFKTKWRESKAKKESLT